MLILGLDTIGNIFIWGEEAHQNISLIFIGKNYVLYQRHAEEKTLL